MSTRKSLPLFRNQSVLTSWFLWLVTLMFLKAMGGGEGILKNNFVLMKKNNYAISSCWRYFAASFVWQRAWRFWLVYYVTCSVTPIINVSALPNKTCTKVPPIPVPATVRIILWPYGENLNFSKHKKKMEKCYWNIKRN